MNHILNWYLPLLMKSPLFCLFGHFLGTFPESIIPWLLNWNIFWIEPAEFFWIESWGRGMYLTRHLFTLCLMIRNKTRCTTTPMRRTSLLWTSFLEIRLPMVTMPISIIISSTRSTFKSLRGSPRWPGWISSLALAASADFVLESALCLLLRFSTGSLSDSAGGSEYGARKISIVYFFYGPSFCK